MSLMVCCTLKFKSESLHSINFVLFCCLRIREVWLVRGNFARGVSYFFSFFGSFAFVTVFCLFETLSDQGRQKLLLCESFWAAGESKFSAAKWVILQSLSKTLVYIVQSIAEGIFNTCKGNRPKISGCCCELSRFMTQIVWIIDLCLQCLHGRLQHTVGDLGVVCEVQSNLNLEHICMPCFDLSRVSYFENIMCYLGK